VERADDPALENAPEALNRLGMHHTNHVLAACVVNGRVREVLVEAFVTNPLIRAEQTDLFGHGFIDESLQSRGADVCDDASNHVALAADSASNNGLPGSGRTGLPIALIPMLVLGLAANESFIDLNDAAELVHVALNERSTDAVAHIPSSFVGAEAHRSHDLECGHSLFAGEHHVSDAIPVPQRLVRVLKDRPGDMGEAIAAVRGALVALPLERHGPDREHLGIAAARAFDAVRPAAGDQISGARFLIRESLLELGDGHLMNWAGLLGHGGAPVYGGQYGI